MSNEQRVKILSPTTLVPLGIVVTCCTAVVVAVVRFHVWISGQFATLGDEIKDLRNSTAQIHSTRFTAQDAEIFALRLKLNNATLNVPDIDEIIKRRQQNTGRP